jgi:hypothetical protein
MTVYVVLYNLLADLVSQWMFGHEFKTASLMNVLMNVKSPKCINNTEGLRLQSITIKQCCLINNVRSYD